MSQCGNFEFNVLLDGEPVKPLPTFTDACGGWEGRHTQTRFAGVEQGGSVAAAKDKQIEIVDVDYMTTAGYHAL